MTVEPLALLEMFLVSLVCGIALEVLWECLGFIGFALRYHRQGGAVTYSDTPLSLIVILSRTFFHGCRQKAVLISGKRRQFGCSPAGAVPDFGCAQR